MDRKDEMPVPPQDEPQMPPQTPPSTLPPEAQSKAKKEHWLVEVTGGATLAMTIVSALSLWWVTLAFNIFA